MPSCNQQSESSGTISEPMELPEQLEEPTTIEEAERLRTQLTLDVQSIQAQLGDKQRTNDTGDRLSQNDYWAWKKRAVFMLNKKLNELRLVKAWIKEHRPARPLPGREALEHLRRVLPVLENIRDNNFPLETDDLVLILSARTYLDGQD